VNGEFVETDIMLPCEKGEFKARMWALRHLAVTQLEGEAFCGRISGPVYKISHVKTRRSLSSKLGFEKLEEAQCAVRILEDFPVDWSSDKIVRPEFFIEAMDRVMAMCRAIELINPMDKSGGHA
jgi:hypothetical protein